MSFLGSSEPQSIGGKIGGFALSTIESFPELFGIEPSKGTQEFRSRNPVSGFLSQAAGAFVPYLGAAKVLRSVPLIEGGIGALEALGGESAIARGALGMAGETAAVEAARLGISATPLPGMAYEAVTGNDEGRTKPLSTMAGESLVNVGLGGVLGGVFGGISAKLAKGTKLSEKVSGAEASNALTRQAEALNDRIAAANDPANPYNPTPEEGKFLEQERNRRIRANLEDKRVSFNEDGTIQIGSDFKQTEGRIFRPLEGEKNDEIGKWLNTQNKRAVTTGGTDEVAVKRFLLDPTNGLDSVDAVKAVEDALPGGLSREELGMHAQDIKVIEVKAGTGKIPEPENFIPPQDFIRTKTGDVLRLAHGTSADIQQWQLPSRGGVSFSTDPEFASNWAGGDHAPPGAKVYLNAVYQSKLADFANPADVAKAAQFIPGMEGQLKTGYWPLWENLDMLKKAGWDSSYMVESPSSGGTSAAKNLFVTKPETITDFYSLNVLGARNSRLLSSAPRFAKNAAHDPSALAAAKRIRQRMVKKSVWRDVGDGVRIAQEAGEDGLFVFNKLVRGDIMAPAPGDQWIVGRTHRLDKIAPRAAAIDKVIKNSAFFPQLAERTAPIGEAIFDAGTRIKHEILDADIPTRPAKEIGLARSALKESAETIGDYAAPAIHLFARNPLAAKIFRIANDLQSIANARTNVVMRGEIKVDPKRSPTGEVLSHRKASDQSLDARIKELDAADRADIQHIYEAEIPFETVKALQSKTDINGNPIFTQRAADFMEAMNFLANDYARRFQVLQAAGLTDTADSMVKTFTAKQGHYVISREYEGPIRYMLHDARDDKIVGMVTGHTPLNAQQNAAKIIENQAKRGREIVVGGLVDETRMTETELGHWKSTVAKPGFLKSRGDVIGYEIQRGELTQAKLSELLERNISRRERHLANVSTQEHIADLMERLQRTAPQDARNIEKRLAIYNNKDTDWTKVQNRTVDSIMRVVGFTGGDSASKIVQGTQTVLRQFQFGFFNLSNPVLNVVGMMQTLLPHIAYTMHASPETLQRLYTSMPLLDSAGNLKGSLGVLSELKVMSSAMQRAFVPLEKQPPEFQELFVRMINEGHISPRFAEKFMGESGDILANPRAAFQDTHSFLKFAGAANELLMSKTEEFSRVMTLAAAYDMGKLAGLSGERLAIFARENFARVNFNYAAADRATIMTTPAGSLLGTFKNWMFHYMGNMLQYAGGGKEALPALFWQTASTALIGGAAATPLVVPMANAASKFFTDKNFMQNLYAATGALGLDERVADGVMYGLPGSMGLSLSAQSASPGSDPMRDAQMIFSFAAFDRMKAMGSAAKDALVAYSVTGESPWEDEGVRRELIRALAPRTIYRSMALSQNLAVQSMATGYDVSHPMGVGSALLYGAGFNPTELEKTYEVYNQIRNDQAMQKATVQELGQTLADAWDSGDDRMANRVFTRATGIGVDVSSVLRSAQARAKRSRETQLDFTASPEDQENFQFMFNQEP